MWTTGPIVELYTPFTDPASVDPDTKGQCSWATAGDAQSSMAVIQLATAALALGLQAVQGMIIERPSAKLTLRLVGVSGDHTGGMGVPRPGFP